MYICSRATEWILICYYQSTPVKDNTNTPTSVCVDEDTVKGTPIALQLQRQLKLPCKNKTELEQLEYKIDIKSAGYCEETRRDLVSIQYFFTFIRVIII